MAFRFLLFVTCASALLSLAACADAPSPPHGGASDGSNGRAIVDSARAAAGAARLDSALLSFTFRGERFRLRRAGGAFSYARTYRDSLGQRVRDVLAGDSLRRRVENRPAPLTDEQRHRAETAVNSVAYFALLPYPLGDAAAQPRYAGADTVRGTPYHRIEVTFAQQGGGRDWQDRFVYWFDRRDYSMDYLAYAYGLGPDEDYGTRFREAFNVRRVGDRGAGVRVADYRNYTARDSHGARDSVPPGALGRYGRLLDADSLRLVSTIALDSVRVRPLDN